MKKVITVISFLVAGFFIKTQAQPAWSRGIQILKLNYGECLPRAKDALLSEGYAVQKWGSDFIEGQKGIHTAIITWNSAANGRIYVNIFIASSAVEETIPAAEREHLQSKMEQHAQLISQVQANWNTQAKNLGGRVGQRFTIYLPPAGTSSGLIWGSDVYTDDSSIGTCAVHAGLISFNNGGTVTIEIRPGQSSYTSTTRNGITSGSYGNWGGSFAFVR